MINKTSIYSLSELKLNKRGKIIVIKHKNFSLQKRLIDMGLTKGVQVSITKSAPFGNPVSIKFRCYELCLRKQDLKHVLVEVIN